ncbi:VanZ family protein [Nocardioides sp. zg-1228]|uniref:VanZ family protein n=1 Tax=Nocardioides sp. zg-1228 TaxID=2763008 RepID=UPI001642BB4C|nr:VanZ family protein [Nocardioides sp. zg-1228]MBC2931889.1 VanZ family protein [Nocardioides sp. zg-1228]QSF57453.1 VanZ family protein [Nocardioides sp. zg-1228]
MVTIGGVGVMALGALAAAVVALLVALAVRPLLGTASAVSFAGLSWSLVVIALVTLVPTRPDVGIVPAEGRSEACSWDYGGPSGAAFEVFGLDQRTLNVLLFVPAAVFLVLAVCRWWAGLVLAPLGLAGLAAYSLVIEMVQLQLARLDRACDVTDIVDNVLGAGIGFVVGVVLLPVVRPWRGRRRPEPRPAH